MWAVDPERYKGARNMLLNRKDVDGKRVPLPVTVSAMHQALRDFIPDHSSRKSQSTESDSLAFVYINTSSRSHQQEGDSSKQTRRH